MLNWVRTWREVASHWQKLRGFFRPIVARTFISWFAIAPIALKIVEQLPESIVFQIGPRSYSVTLALPFSWYLLWTASFAYFLAYVLYLLTSPRFVREFPDFSSFLTQSHSPRFLVWELSRVWRDDFGRPKIARRLIDKGLAEKIDTPIPIENPYVATRGTVFVFDFDKERYEVVAHEDDAENRQRELFWEIFGQPARYAPVRRNFTWFLLSISFLLVLVVVCQQIWFVINYLLLRSSETI